MRLMLDLNVLLDVVQAPPKPAAAPKPTKVPKRLTYKEKQEWDRMEEAILEAEDALASAQAAVEDPAVASDSKAG